MNIIVNINQEISNKKLYSYFYNISDIEIIFKPNESGFSKDIDGQIKIYYKSTNIKEWNLRYNIKENGIFLFPHLII